MLPREILQKADSNFEDFLFYDIEVFDCENLAVFKAIDKTTVAMFRNGVKLYGKYNSIRELITGKVLVGYNNYNYDDYILSQMMAYSEVDGTGIAHESPNEARAVKALNDYIISGHRPYIAVNEAICSLDCFQQVQYKSSLKKIEANIGQSIDETQVDFNKIGLLNMEEWDSTIQYCERDVSATIDVFKLRWNEYFKPKLSLLMMLDEDIQERFMRYYTTTIGTQVLTGGRKARQWHTRRFAKDSYIEDYTLPIFENTPEKVLNMWRDSKEDVKKTELQDLECDFVFAFGGLHGAHSTKKVWKERPSQKIMLLDVASMYPNIILQINGLGEEPTKKYKQIVEDRLAVKKTDKTLATALKLVINSTYGLLKNEYSKLYNPNACQSVCIYGQAALFDLCLRLYNAGYELININTDGVCFYGDEDSYKAVQKEWEAKFGLKLELSTFTKWIQRDVNNYVAVDTEGNIKVKGGDVNKYNDPTDFTGDLLNESMGINWSGNYSKGIIARSIVNALVYNKPTEQTILESLNEPLLFQIVLQAGKTYRGVIDTQGCRDYQKVNRVFASKTGIRLLKERYDGALNEFPDMPEHMMVYNGDLQDLTLGDEIDLNYYNELARSKLEKWVAF